MALVLKHKSAWHGLTKPMHHALLLLILPEKYLANTAKNLFKNIMANI
jgi:hypothetical protein